MYPRLSDLINALLGTHIELPAKTFGFFLALAFAAAFLTLRHELVRREKLGQFRLRAEKIRTAGPVPFWEVLLHVGVWGLAGYKLGYMVVNYKEFSDHTQEVLMSEKGWWPGVLIGIGLGAGSKMWEWYRKREEKEAFRTEWVGPAHYIGTVTMMAFVAGILGSKLFAYLEDLPGFFKDPVGALLSLDGLSFLGGLLCAGYLISRFLHRRGFHLLTAMDSFAPPMILAYAVGRIGCHMSGDGDWGVANLRPNPGFLPDWLWGYTYPHNVAQMGVRAQDCLGEFCTVLPQPVWPTPLYETLMGLTIFGILWFLRKKVKFPGMITGIYFILIGLERFSIEMIRINKTHSFLGMSFSQAQWIALGMMVGGSVILYAVWKVRRPFDSFPPPGASEKTG